MTFGSGRVFVHPPPRTPSSLDVQYCLKLRLLPLGVSLALGVMQHASQATITNAHKFVLAKTFAWMGLIVVLGAIRDIIEVD